MLKLHCGNRSLFMLALSIIAALLSACAQDKSTDSETPLEDPADSAYHSSDEYLVDVFEGYIVHDALRRRSIKILLRYPLGAPNPLPLIVWSHGGEADSNGHNAYREWGEALATAGYAVIHLAHEDDVYNAHCAALRIPAGECEPGDFDREVAQGGTLEVLWLNRARDASAVLDDLAGIEAATGLQFHRTRIGAAGHSGGAHTVMTLAGVYLDISPSVHNLRAHDLRFSAFLACSPHGVGRLGLNEASWNSLSAPMMMQTGAADMTAEEDAASRLDAFTRMPPPEKYLLYIDSPSATHRAFALNFATGDTTLAPFLKASALAFFDAYLRNLAAAKAWLASDKINQWSRSRAKITKK